MKTTQAFAAALLYPMALAYDDNNETNELVAPYDFQANYKPTENQI